MRKNKRKESRNTPDSQFNSLDSQLGTFGLEPPKRYRPEQELSGSNDSKQKRIRSKSKSKSKHNKNPKVNHDRILTPDEKRREHNKKRRQKKLIRRIISLSLIVIAATALLVTLSLTFLFKIDTIQIVGNESYTNNEITAVLPIEKEDNLFISDTKGASEKLTQNLPYIYKAEVKRKFPSTIVVNITEAEKIYAVVNRDKTYTLLDKDLKVLECDVIKRPQDSVVIRRLVLSSAEPGKTAGINDEKQMADILNLTNAIDSMKLDEITAIYSKDINNNYMTYDKRITYKLGTTEDLESKLYSALSATEKLNETDPGAHGEMTVSGGKQIYFTKK